jgi:hypothetical protein
MHCTATAICFVTSWHGSPKIAVVAGMLHLQRAHSPFYHLSHR